MKESKASKLKEIAVMFEPFTAKKFSQQYDGDTIRYRLAFVTIDKSDNVRNPGHWEEDRSEFYDLEFTAYIRTSAEKWETYGWSCDFRNVYCVELRDCERMLKMLRKIGKIDQSFVVRPSSFGQFVALTAAGLGASRFVRVRGGERGWHNENDHQFSDIKYLADKIDTGIAEERERLYPKFLESVAV